MGSLRGYRLGGELSYSSAGSKRLASGWAASEAVKEEGAPDFHYVRAPDRCVSFERSIRLPGAAL